MMPRPIITAAKSVRLGRIDMPMGPHRNKDDARTDCFNVTGLGIALKRVRASLALQIAAVVAQMPQQGTAFHSTVTVSRVTPLGRPRSASARRSRRIRAIAAARLFRAAAFVRPCPFAPGTSAQYARNHLPSRSIIAVNSFRMAPLYRAIALATVAV